MWIKSLFYRKLLTNSSLGKQYSLKPDNDHKKTVGLNFQKYKDCQTNKQLQPQTHTDRQPVTFKQEFVPNME